MTEQHSGFTLLGNIDGNSNTYKCVNMVDPTDAQDYVTKNYADITYAVIAHNHDTAYLKLDGSNASANISISTYTFTAANFTSSVATGTQPFACTSTTANTNLNADMVDGSHASAFATTQGEGYICIVPENMDSVTQGTWIIADDASNWSSCRFYNSSNTLNDEVVYNVYLAAGTYTLRLHYRGVTAGGKCTIYLDSTAVVAEFSMYAGGASPNNTKTQTGIVVSTSAIYSLKFKCTATNSPGGSTIDMHNMSLWRTA